MPEVHLARLDDHESDAPVVAATAATTGARGRHAPWKLLLEVVLISVGVFLGLAGEQWRESTHRRELAHAALQRFRTELADNRKAVAHVKDYHATLRTSLKGYFATPPRQRNADTVQILGVQPAQFETSAWDMALATQSLGDVPQDIGLDLSRLYRLQQSYTELSRGLLQSMYTHSPYDGTDGFMASLAVWVDDAVLLEPALLDGYDKLLPKLDAALRE